MMETGTDSEPVTWSVPECPFTIEYSPRVLDDIRLGVIDAFFSLPRGGAEIGGILLGKHENRRLVISDYAALDCEHAFGPSFTLSQSDEAKLAELLASAGGRAIGWYHSHTRSEIFLSDVDLEIHRRFFPEPWQIALVMKPHTFQPARIGFFFREADGSLRASAAYGEIVLKPLPMGPAGGAASELPPQGDAVRSTGNRIANGTPDTTIPKTTINETAAIEVTATTIPAPAMTIPVPAMTVAGPAMTMARPQPHLDPNPKPPNFLTAQPPRSRPWLAVIGMGVALGMIAGGYQTRQVWLPRVTAAVRSAPGLPAPPMTEAGPAMTVAGPPPSLGLNTMDREGQLQIVWDRNSGVVRQGLDAILEITDGGPPRAILLDAAHLQTGTFTYARQGERVDVKLIVRQPEGAQVREATSFLGKLPERQPVVVDPEIAKQRDELAEQAAKLKRELNSQAARTKKLEKALLDSVRREVQSERRRRLANQVPDIRK
jgi:proteasome lid subunit RPN8/RPN11